MGRDRVFRYMDKLRLRLLIANENIFILGRSVVLLLSLEPVLFSVKDVIYLCYAGRPLHHIIIRGFLR